ncbi:hypothetical protein BOO69_16995 [Sulfitobacter alexandrii]|uniref:Uncharacterized protein n=1 Tax=Sulfitobacter alexandrii TaxID=1917485 RepID=A0A1J0WKT9_9RHOB|nr:hypothetical protein [Sulfitobacter alexandrii]APE44914.1 hypothetical protein BOO69_16995 [Sulfitobacter alexandrii]
MPTLELTKTKMRQGVWQGVITGAGDDMPKVQITHQNRNVESFELVHNEKADHWLLSVTIPPEAISDGVQTLMIRDATAETDIGHITLMAGEVLGDDIRAEVDLLRAELDMLKRAFRRHCVETA